MRLRMTVIVRKTGIARLTGIVRMTGIARIKISGAVRWKMGQLTGDFVFPT